MKKIILLTLMPLLLLACNNGEQAATNGTQTTPADGIQALSAGDSIVSRIDEERIYCYIKAEAPDPQLAKAMGEWIDDELGGDYPGDPADLQAIVSFYGKAIADTLRKEAKDCYDPTMAMEYEATIEKVFETDKVVTYALNTYMHIGGAHPSSRGLGVTFRKSDGRRLDWNIVRSYCQYELTEMIKERLKDYFGVSTEEEFENCLTGIETYNLPLPQTPPYFLENGIAFIYQQYEITAYAYGMPNDVIPYDSIRPMLSGWAKQLIEGL
jgi:hypothetical protein